MVTSLASSKSESLPSKIPPQNVEAEKAILACLLIDEEAITKALEVLREEDFYREAHRRIFRGMVALFQKSEPTDFLTLSNYLQTLGELELVGGASYLSGLVDLVPSSANILSYCRIVREKALVRRLIETSAEIATMGYEAVEDIEGLMDQAEKMIFNLSESRIRPSFSPVKDVVKDSFKRIEQLFENKGKISGLPTGFSDFDNITCGLQPNDLLIIAGRPSMGKTALAMNIAENVAIHHKGSVAIFSLEMSKEQLVTRMLCSQAFIDSSKLRKGFLDEKDWPQLTKAAGHLSEASIYIDDTPAITVLEMRAKSRRLKREHGLDLILVDYLQLVRGGFYTQNREQEISEISRSLKALAKELKVPVVALSQLNRAVENRNNRRPQMSDLRESGAIEQDADVIVFIYRDEVYDPHTPNPGVAELIISKQRNGPIGTVRLAFLSQHTKFENLAFQSQTEMSQSDPGDMGV